MCASSNLVREFSVAMTEKAVVARDGREVAARNLTKTSRFNFSEALFMAFSIAATTYRLRAVLFAMTLMTSFAAAESTTKGTDFVRVFADQMHQLEVVKVAPHAFLDRRSAIGQIAFNEDASTIVLTPFSGRVTRLIAKVGNEVKRGDPLFEIDSPEVVQAQTDLIAALQALQKAKSQLALAKRVLDRQTNLLAGRATSQ